MTGRDLIIFIMENHLEDVVIFNDGIPGFMTVEESAIKWSTGKSTILALCSLGKLEYVRINDAIYISKNQENPIKKG